MPLPDSDSFSTFGGAKTDYQPVENPSTDYAAAQLNPAFCDVAETTRTVPRGFVRMTCAASTGGLVLVDWDAVWKGATGTLPVLGRTSTGVFTITLPTTVSDEFNSTQGLTLNHTVNIRAVIGLEIEGGTFGFINGTPTSANVITVQLAGSGGSASDFAGTNIVVCWR